MMIEEIVGFLKGVPPFQYLDEEALDDVARSVVVDFFPKDAVILEQDGPPSPSLMVIRNGGIKVSVGADEKSEVVLDYRTEGDVVGFLSVVSGDKSRARVAAIEDTTVYRIGREKILALLGANPRFADHYFKSFIPRFIDKAFAHVGGGAVPYGEGEKILFTTAVGSLATKEVVSAPDTITIREAASIMSARNVSSLVLLDAAGALSGIVTDRDFREKTAAVGRDGGEGVAAVMSRALTVIDGRQMAFEALLTMIRHGIHHLIVVDGGGRVAGVITNHDLMLVQGNSPLSLTRDIEGQQTIEGVARAALKINGMIPLLLKEGAKAASITRMVTEINDRLVMKVVRIAEGALGPPPVRYCWITFGSEGRKEQTFKTDQDNALVYEDPRTPAEEAAARAYFPRFAAFVNDALVRCGFPECPGGYMARTPEWCQPLAAWKRYFSAWIATPTEEAILRSVILFDFRPVAGTAALGEALKAHLLAELPGRQIFLQKMCDLAVSVRPPLGFFRNFVVLKSGEHKDTLDLKKKCLTPLINVVRLYALQEAVPATPTLARIAALAERDGIVREHAEELEQAYEFFMLLRINHQHRQIEGGREPDNFVNPNDLSAYQKKLFRESCGAISTVLDYAFRQYNPGQRL